MNEFLGVAILNSANLNLEVHVWSINKHYYAVMTSIMTEKQYCISLKELGIFYYIMTTVHSAFYWSRIVIYQRTDARLMPFQ